MAWKKLGCNNKKGSRISRIVSDLQPPKMGDSSLVVATGFPTSLVDLFVKNRARLRRPRNKKGGKNQPEQEEEEDSLVISDPVVVSCSRDVGPGENVEEEAKFESLREEEIKVESSREEEVKVEALGKEEEEEEVKVESLSEDGNYRREGSCGGGGRKVGLGGLFRVVLVLGLCLNVKKMVVGVTLSAFALILLDCCWRRLWLLLFEPCIGLVRRVLGLVWWVGREKEEEEEGDVVVGLCDDDGDALVSDGEIQVVECDKEEEREVMGCELELDLVGCEERVVECEKEQSKKGGKIRRKIVKNLVPKKIRSGVKKRRMKRKEKELGLENAAFDCPGDSRGKVQVSQNNEGDVDDEESSRTGSISEDSHGIGSCSFTQELQTDEGIMVPVDEEIRVPANESKRNYGYGIVLLVLAGLVGGRIAAFLLTVGLCLVLKLAKRWRRHSLLDH